MMTPVNSRVIGEENIDAMRDLIRRGEIVTTAIDHKSLADMYTVAATAFQEGFNDLVELATFVISVKYSKRFPTNLIKRVIKIVDIVPHTIDESKFPDKDNINQRAIEQAHNAAPGSLWVIAPEGRRTAGVMEGGRYGSKEFWHGPEGSTEGRIIVPIAIEGTERQWPKGKSFVYFLRKGRYEEALFIFGKPIKVADIDEVAFKIAGGDEELFRRYQVDVVMALIASQHLSSLYTEKFSELVATLKNQPLFRT